MAIFFLFFTTGFASRSLLAEREQGTLPRILASPVRKTSVIVGKAISGFVLGVVSVAVMFGSLGLLFDVSWGDPLALVVLTVVTVLAVMGLTALVQLLTKTNEQADALSSAVAAGLAMVGGNFFPIFQLPEVIQRISLLTPNGWALRGFTDVAYDGATLADLGPHIAVIAAFAVVTGGIAFMRAQRLAVR
jgi:ABC-2 type transport system permease protein